VGISTSRAFAWVLLGAAAAAVVAGAIVLATNSGTTIADFQRITFAAGQRSVQLTSGRWVGYYESGARTTSHIAVPDFRPLIRDPSGAQVNIENYAGGRKPGPSYDKDGHRGTAVFQFQAPRSGSYDVRLQFAGALPPGADVAIGRDLAAPTSTPPSGILLVVAGGLGVAGSVLLLVSRSRRRSPPVVSGDA
jgi:hypothetical protein